MSRSLPADFRPSPPDRQFRVTSADGTELAVQVHGDDHRPTVVLSHGWTLASSFWARVVHRLADDLRVVTYDQRGHGSSAAARPGTHTVDALADDVVAVLEGATRAGEKVVWAGHSMGGMALVAAAGRRADTVAEHVGAALLVSTGMNQLIERAAVLPARRVKGSATGEVRRAGRTRHALTTFGLTDPRALYLLPRPAARRILQGITMSAKATTDEVVFAGDVVLSCPRTTWVGFARMLAGLDLHADLARLDVPALVLVGSRDRLTPPWHSHRMVAALPKPLGLLTAPGSGHMTPATDPDRIAAAIRGLVDDHLLAAPAAGVPTAATVSVPAPAPRSEG